MADAPTPAGSEVQPPKPQQRDYTPPLPKQVRDQIAQAEQIRADIETVSAPEEPAPSPEAPGTPPQPASPEGAPPAGDETWEQRARSMAGRLEQATKTNQALAERMQALEKQLTTLQMKPQPAVAEPPKPKPKLITPEEERDYGTDFLQVVGKRAKEEFAPEFDMLADRLRRLEGRIDSVGTVIEKTQVNDVYGTLRGVVPNWREINHSAEFKQWLAHPDLYSGRKRHEMLKEAFAGHDAKRVVAFFQGFLTEATGLPQGSQALAPSAPPLPGSGNGSGRPTLEDYAAPGRARSAPQELPPDKPVYTSAWIAQFSRDKLRGVYRGREADVEAIERDIYAAQHEGRVQQ